MNQKFFSFTIAAIIILAAFAVAQNTAPVAAPDSGVPHQNEQVNGGPANPAAANPHAPVAPVQPASPSHGATTTGDTRPSGASNSASGQAHSVPIQGELPLHNDLQLPRQIGFIPKNQTPPQGSTITPVLTQHNDTSRTGQYLTETTLTPSNVNSTQFGKIFSYSVDGQIYAQPLYVPGVMINGVSHNVVYVVTENDSLYAFDADGLSSAPLWQVSYLNSTSSLNVVPVPCGTDGSTTDISCNIFPYYGITGTPVINLTSSSPAAGTMYFVVRTQETPTNGVPNFYQRLHAVDITTGLDVTGSPVVVSGTFPGIGAGSSGGTVVYDPEADIQRVGLTLANGNVYIGWAGAAHGWIMAYNATTLAQVAVFNTAPNYVLGGIWQTGNGFVVDSSGNLYLSVGDAVFDASALIGGPYTDDYGDTTLKLSPTLQELDYFTPMDQLCRGGNASGTDQDNDLDLGSSGPILLPTQGGTAPDELLVTGKSGYGITGSTCDTTDVYLLNLDGTYGMGKYETGSGDTDNVVQELTDPPGPVASVEPQGFWSSAAFWQGTESADGTSGTSYVYMAGTTALSGGNYGASLDQYNINGVTGGSAAMLSTTPTQSTNLFPQGSTPSVSSNGSTNGIVWAIERVDSLNLAPGDLPAILYAYNATDVSTMLYNSAQQVSRDQGGCANKFQVPTIANGKVYVATQSQLDVYGLLPASTAAPWVYIASPCYTWQNPVNIGEKSAAQTFTIQNSGTASLSISRMQMTGPNGGDFRLTNKCGVTLGAGKSCEISVTFAPTLGVPEIAYVSVTDNAVGSPHNIRVVGTGNGPSVVVEPAYLSFGHQDIGIASAAQNITVANSSNLPVTVSGITITGTNANLFTQTNNCGTTIEVDANCTINVTFEPVTTGQDSASLNIFDNAGGPQSVSLTGVGVQPNAVVSPDQISFGQVAVGKSSSPEPVTVSNNGNGEMFISSITFTGPNPGDFSQTNNCNGVVAAQSSCTINVTFKPTASGTREAYLTLNDNSSPSPQLVSLSGDGT
jgi:hypothetical protein